MKKCKYVLLYLVLMVILVACTGAQPATEAPEAVATEPTATTASEGDTPEAPTPEASSSNNGSKDRGAGDTLVILYDQAPSVAVPYIGSSTQDFDAGALVLEPLAAINENGVPAPRLAQTVPTIENGGISEDLMSITWTLKEDLLWSDGTPVTSEDVVFTYEYCTNPETGCILFAAFADIASVEAIDALTAKITFLEPSTYPYKAFAASAVPVIQKAQFESCVGAAAIQCAEENQHPIGTGPYKVKEFRANDVVVFEINEFYREPDKPYFKEVNLKGGGDTASAARAVLETGEADYASNLQIEPEILTQMAKGDEGILITAFGSSVEMLMLNQTNPDPELGEQRSEWAADNPNPHPFLQDPAVWQAMSMAIDRTVIATELYGQAGKPICNVLSGPPAYVSANNDACLQQDIEGAKALLDKAGWVPGPDGIRAKDGVELRLLFLSPTNPVRQKTQALINQWWSEIGIEAELKNVDPGAFYSSDPSSPDIRGKFYGDVLLMTMSSPTVDPQIYMSLWICGQIPTRENNWARFNLPRYCNPDYDTMVGELSQMSIGNPDRTDLVKKMNDILVAEGALLPIVHRGVISAQSSDLVGIRMNPWDSELWNIADWIRVSQ